MIVSFALMLGLLVGGMAAPCFYAKREREHKEKMYQ